MFYGLFQHWYRKCCSAALFYIIEQICHHIFVISTAFLGQALRHYFIFIREHNAAHFNVHTKGFDK